MKNFFLVIMFIVSCILIIMAALKYSNSLTLHAIYFNLLAVLNLIICIIFIILNK
jgi:hypothetical protein